MSEAGLADWRRLQQSGLYDELAADGRMVRTEETAEVVPAQLGEHWAGVLAHEQIPFVSYPYEWTFGMLKDAALLQLELVQAALERDLILKDSSPYNVQFRGARPTFIDVGSFEELRPGLRAVDRLPAVLHAVPLPAHAARLQGRALPALAAHGDLDGIEPGELRNLLSLRDRFRRGVLTHVILHARLERSQADRGGEVKRELKRVGFRKELIQANVRKLHKLVSRLRWEPTPAPSGSLTASTTPTPTARPSRRPRSSPRPPRRNTGRASGTSAATTGASRRSPPATPIRSLRSTATRASSRSSTGACAAGPRGHPAAHGEPDRPVAGPRLAGLERRTLEARGTPDLVLCLALVHHVAITGNVPIAAFLDWLRSLDAALVIELPLREDPMVRRLLQAKRDGLHTDYTREHFEECLRARFTVQRTEERGRASSASPSRGAERVSWNTPMRVLVTGARGKVGAATVAALLRDGAVTASDRLPPAFERPGPATPTVQADVAGGRRVRARAWPRRGGARRRAPRADAQPAHTVFQNNVMATFNTLEAAVRFGVARFVHVSSETVPGFFFPERPFLPDYAPIDEEHPVRPQDPYALAKHFGEQLMDAATRRSDLRDLHPPVVGAVGGQHRAEPRPDRARARGTERGLWSYIDAYDLADALLLAAESELAGHEVVYIASPDNVAGQPLAELLHEHYGDAIELRPLDRPDASGTSIAKARRLLGYDPRRSWRDYIDDDGRLRPEVRARLERGETDVQAGRAADAG